MDVQRAIATALRLIEKNGQAVVYRKPAAADPSAAPWRDLRSGEPWDTPVRVAWIKPKLRTLAFLQNEATTEIPKGVELALMAGGLIEVDLTDLVLADGRACPLFRADPVKPSGVPILWTLWINRAGSVAL